MATGPKVTTSGMSKAMDNSSRANSPTGNSNNKGKNISFQENTPIPTFLHTNPGMDIDLSLTSTREPGIHEITLQQTSNAEDKER